jgi:NADH-quinone oxidoreductase subunit F
MSKNLSALSGRQGLHNNLFERLGQLSEPTGAPEKEDLQKLADEFLVGSANVYGAATFYDFTRPENKGKKIYVCNGSACLAAGTQDKLRANLSTHFSEEEIGEMCCLGRCHENSAFHYQGHNYSGENMACLEQVIAREPGCDGRDKYRVASRGRAILSGPALTPAACSQVVETLLAQDPENLLASIRTSGLRGRGGAGFPSYFKMDACRKAPGDTKFIVCNADEGDPGSFSDRYLLEQQPLLVLAGLMIAGYVVGAAYGVIYIRAEYPESVDIIEKAVADMKSQGLLGEGIKGSHFNFDIKVIKARGAYICGEETALLASIEGQRPEVRVRPPYPAQSGLFGKPTVVNNVETLANLPYILTQGGEAYAAMGTPKSTGTKLISLDSSFRNPGVYEVSMGTPLSVVIEELGGGFHREVKALHIGGPLGGLVPVQKIPDLTVDFESFAQNGFMLGHASIIGIPEEFPMIAYLEHLFAFTAHESCGKCFPCRLGSVRGQELLHKAQTESYQVDPVLFNDLLTTLEKGSLCALGGGIPLPVRNALQYFAEELSPYFQGSRQAASKPANAI